MLYVYIITYLEFYTVYGFSKCSFYLINEFTFLILGPNLITNLIFYVKDQVIS